METLAGEKTPPCRPTRGYMQSHMLFSIPETALLKRQIRETRRFWISSFQSSHCAACSFMYICIYYSPALCCSSSLLRALLATRAIQCALYSFAPLVPWRWTRFHAPRPKLPAARKPRCILLVTCDALTLWKSTSRVSASICVEFLVCDTTCTCTLYGVCKYLPMFGWTAVEPELPRLLAVDQ